MATVGDQLLQPEAGWRRYDDHNARVLFINTTNTSQWVRYIEDGCWNKTNTTSGATGTVGAKIRFRFKGTKLRIIARKGDNSWRYSNQIKITIDSNPFEIFSEYGPLLKQVIVYEKLDLTNTEHVIEIENLEDYAINLDAIDIDETGTLLHPYLPEKTTLASMEIGDVISCEYISNTGNNSNGFNNLGNDTKPPIDPKVSSANPDGSFFFIKVDKGLLIADRVLQHTVRWDQLNLSKLINGSLYRMHYNSQKISPGCLIDYIDPKTIYFRTLTGVAHTGAYIAIQKPMKATGTLVVEYDYYCTGSYSSAKNHYLHICKDFKTTEAYYNSPANLNAGVFFNGGFSPINTWVKIKYTINFTNNTQSILVNNTGHSVGYTTPTGMTATDDVYVCIGVGPYEVALNDGLRNLKFTYNGEVSEIDFTIPNVLVRSMTGGIAALAANGTPSLTHTGLGAFPTENEYDKYIKGSTLGGKITPGDNAIWNINDKFHWCKEPALLGTHVSATGTTAVALNTWRIARGFETRPSAFKGLGLNIASGADAVIGFRPVLEYIDNNGQTNNWY